MAQGFAGCGGNYNVLTLPNQPGSLALLTAGGQEIAVDVRMGADAARQAVWAVYRPSSEGMPQTPFDGYRVQLASSDGLTYTGMLTQGAIRCGVCGAHLHPGAVWLPDRPGRGGGGGDASEQCTGTDLPCRDAAAAGGGRTGDPV